MVPGIAAVLDYLLNRFRSGLENPKAAQTSSMLPSAASTDGRRPLRRWAVRLWSNEGDSTKVVLTTYLDCWRTP